MTDPAASLQLAVAAALTEKVPSAKAAATRNLAKRWGDGDLALNFPLDQWPDPATRARPPLAAPGSVPKRRLGTPAGKIALLHAVGHIELNAIDLALDIVGRFTSQLPSREQRAFVNDWLSVADDEARHFTLVSNRLEEMGAAYGDLPAHSGLWDAASRTADDLLARLAIAPMVLEARGLDVTPGMIERLTRVGDHDSVAVLKIIYEEEVGHVGTGTKWFRKICSHRGLEPDATFAEMVGQHFPGGLKTPFNHPARAQSEFPRDWYEGLA